MRELLHSRSGHGKHHQHHQHHRSEADHHETTKAAAWAVFQRHGGGGIHRHNLCGHAVRQVTRFKIEAQMKHAMAHHSTSHMPTDANVNWDAGSTLFDSFELDSLCKQLGHSFHPVAEIPHPQDSSFDENDHPRYHAHANPNPNLGPRPYPRPAPQHGHPGLQDPTEDADAHHYQVGRELSLVDGVLVPISMKGRSYRLTRNGRGHGDGHGSGMYKDDEVGKLDTTGHAHTHAHHHHSKLANPYRWWKDHHHHKRQPSEKTSSDDETGPKDESDDLHAHDHHKSLKWKLTHLFHHSHHHHQDHQDVSLHMLHGAHKRISPHDALEKGHKGRENHIIAKILDHGHKHHHGGDEGDKDHRKDPGGHNAQHGNKHNSSARKDLYIAKDVDLPRDHHKWQEDFDHHNHHHHHLHLPHALKSGLRMVLPRALCQSVHMFRDKDDSDLEDSAGYDFHHDHDHHLLSNNKGDLHQNNYYGNDHDGSHIVHKEEEGPELEYHHDHHHHYHHHHNHHREEKHDYELTVQAIVRRVPRKSFEQMARRLSIEEIGVKAPRNSLENFEQRVRRSSGEDQSLPGVG